jgi:O-antigen ligase
MGVSLFLLFVRRPPKFNTVLLFVLLMLPVTQLLPGGYLDRLSTLVDLIPGLSETSVKEEYSFRGRSSAQIAGWMMFRDHPITGVGLGNFPAHYQEYSRQLGIDGSRWEQAPHNLYLEILTERGLIGLSAFAVLLWFLFRGMQTARETFLSMGMINEAGLIQAFSIGLIAYLIAATFLQASYPRYFWLMVGIGFAMPNVANRTLAAREEAAYG